MMWLHPMFTKLNCYCVQEKLDSPVFFITSVDCFLKTRWCYCMQCSQNICFTMSKRNLARLCFHNVRGLFFSLNRLCYCMQCWQNRCLTMSKNQTFAHETIKHPTQRQEPRSGTTVISMGVCPQEWAVVRLEINTKQIKSNLSNAYPSTCGMPTKKNCSVFGKCQQKRIAVYYSTTFVSINATPHSHEYKKLLCDKFACAPAYTWRDPCINMNAWINPSTHNTDQRQDPARASAQIKKLETQNNDLISTSSNFKASSVPEPPPSCPNFFG